MNVGERIKQRRIELHMSQEELAKKVGYKSRSSINKIELSRDLPLRKVEKMAYALDTTPAYLMGWDKHEINNVGKALKEIAKTDADLRIMEMNLHLPEGLLDSILNEQYSTIPINILTKIADYFDVGISSLLQYNTCRISQELNDAMTEHDLGMINADSKLAAFLITIGYELYPNAMADNKVCTLTNLETKESIELSKEEFTIFKRHIKRDVNNCFEFIKEIISPGQFEDF